MYLLLAWDFGSEAGTWKWLFRRCGKQPEEASASRSLAPLWISDFSWVFLSLQLLQLLRAMWTIGQRHQMCQRSRNVMATFQNFLFSVQVQSDWFLGLCQEWHLELLTNLCDTSLMSLNAVRNGCLHHRNSNALFLQEEDRYTCSVLPFEVERLWKTI